MLELPLCNDYELPSTWPSLSTPLRTNIVFDTSGFHYADLAIRRLVPNHVRLECDGHPYTSTWRRHRRQGYDNDRPRPSDATLHDHLPRADTRSQSHDVAAMRGAQFRVRRQPIPPSCGGGERVQQMLVCAGSIALPDGVRWTPVSLCLGKPCILGQPRLGDCFSSNSYVWSDAGETASGVGPCHHGDDMLVALGEIVDGRAC